jgi:hypothetical protein
MCCCMVCAWYVYGVCTVWQRNVDRELEVLSVTPLGQRISHALLWPMREFLAAALHLDPDLRLQPRDALSCQWCGEPLHPPNVEL